MDTVDTIPSPSVETFSSRLRGLTVSGLRAGDGGRPPLILLHGFPQTSLEWKALMPHLATNRLVVAPDLRGFGDSHPDRFESISRELLASDLENLLDTLGLEEVNLVGHDWGGIVAGKFAMENPHRVRTLVLIDTILTTIIPRATPHFIWYKLPGVAEREIGRDSDAYVRSLIRRYSKVDNAIDPEDLEVYCASLRSESSQRHAVSYYRDAVTLYRLGDDSALSGFSPADCEAWWAMAPSDARWSEPLIVAPDDLDHRLPMPVTWVYGRGLGRPNTAFRRQFEQSCSNLRSVELDCGHWIPDELAAELIDVIRTAITSN